MSKQLVLFASFLLLALLYSSPAAAEWNGGFQQDWGGAETECMGDDDVFCAGWWSFLTSGSKYADCLAKVEQEGGSLVKQCHGKCACKYQKDLAECSILSGGAKITCNDTALRMRQVCDVACES